MHTIWHLVKGFTRAIKQCITVDVHRQHSNKRVGYAQETGLCVGQHCVLIYPSRVDVHVPVSGTNMQHASDQTGSCDDGSMVLG